MATHHSGKENGDRTRERATRRQKRKKKKKKQKTRDETQAFLWAVAFAGEEILGARTPLRRNGSLTAVRNELITSLCHSCVPLAALGSAAAKVVAFFLRHLKCCCWHRERTTVPVYELLALVPDVVADSVLKQPWLAV